MYASDVEPDELETVMNDVKSDNQDPTHGSDYKSEGVEIVLLMDGHAFEARWPANWDWRIQMLT